MKILYIECGMGASGDMLMSALSELIENQDLFIERMNSLRLTDIRVKKYIIQSFGVTGTSIGIREGGLDGQTERSRSSNYVKINHIMSIIDVLPVSPWVKGKVSEVYKVIAEAESQVRGIPYEDIHLYEVGQLDAVAYITGVCMLLEEIGAEKIVVSPICTGKGSVETRYGVQNVPVPLTANILTDVPSYAGEVESELCTPTGAAILKVFADEFKYMPSMTSKKTGVGIGKKAFDRINCIRVFCGDYFDEKIMEENAELSTSIAELRANIDDMTPEMIADAMEILFENGALDVYTIPINMKKNRPAVMLNCMCKIDEAPKFAKLILKYTTTIGVRQENLIRYVLDSYIQEKETEYGAVKVKKSVGYGVKKYKAEFEDIKKIARDTGVPAYIIAKNLEK